MNSLPQKALKKAQKIVLGDPYKKDLPDNHQAEDVFLVSYPKSGNTWLRFVIANALKVHYQINREVNFFTVHDIIPSLSFSRHLRDEGPFGRKDLPRIIKSHSGYNPYYQRVILVIRDPRDVVVSYYHYLRSFKGIPDNLTLSEFVRNKKYGASAWAEHTKSWVLTNKEGQNIQLFLYEDWIKEPKAQLYRLMNLLGLYLDDASLEKALELSSLESMKKSEMLHRSTYVVRTQESAFVRKGKATGGKTLEDGDRQFVEEVSREIAQVVGYEF